MYIVIITALGVGGATVFGAVLGFIFKGISHRFSDVTLALSAGVMLAAAIIGLVMPSIENGGILLTIVGIFVGAICINFLDKLVPHLHKFGANPDVKPRNRRIERVMLFVMAIAIHNLPEGIAAGVGFGSGDIANAILIAGGIALQNIPEGMVIIAPMLSAGIRPAKTFIIALLTGFIEVVGTFIGYFAVSICTEILPFALAFAGGTMLYIISDEIIPDTHEDGGENGATYALLAGFSLMLLFDALLSSF